MREDLGVSELKLCQTVAHVRDDRNHAFSEIMPEEGEFHFDPIGTFDNTRNHCFASLSRHLEHLSTALIMVWKNVSFIFLLFIQTEPRNNPREIKANELRSSSI